jgi:hypothetical protein
MPRADIATTVNTLREAFLASGKGTHEKRTVAGHAFLVDGRAVGHIERRANAVRARLWLPDKERKAFEARPTFDRESGWLYVVSAEDVAFVREMAKVAHRAAAAGERGISPPGASKVEITPATPAPAAMSGIKKKTASPRRPSMRT